MYGAFHIIGTWGSKEVGRLKLLYKGGKPQRGAPSFSERGGESTLHAPCLKEKILPLPGYFTSLYWGLFKA